MSQENSPDHLLRAIVTEVDEAREVQVFAEQLLHSLPLKNFEDVVAALKKQEGKIIFRGRALPIEPFAAQIPAFLFPIDSVKKLVTVLYAIVRKAPKHVPYAASDAVFAKVSLYRHSILGIPVGTLGKPGQL